MNKYFINILILNMQSKGYKCPDSSENVDFLQITHVTTSMIHFVFSKFRTELKQAYILPARKYSNVSKEAYRLISILPNVSKIYKWRVLIRSNSRYIEQIISWYNCSFRKGYTPQHWHYLLAMIKKWKKL